MYHFISGYTAKVSFTLYTGVQPPQPASLFTAMLHVILLCMLVAALFIDWCQLVLALTTLGKHCIALPVNQTNPSISMMYGPEKGARRDSLDILAQKYRCM